MEATARSILQSLGITFLIVSITGNLVCCVLSKVLRVCSQPLAQQMVSVWVENKKTRRTLGNQQKQFFHGSDIITWEFHSEMRVTEL